MRPLVAVLSLLFVPVALSGCIQDSTLSVAHAGVGAAADTPVADEGASEHWSTTVDLLPYLREDRVALVAFRATEDLRLDVRMDKELSHDADGTVCSLGSLRPRAPVDHLIDVSNNRGGVAPDHTPGGGGYGGTSGSELLRVTVDGKRVFDGGDGLFGTSTSSSRAEASMGLEEGEWLLVTAGLYGLDPDDLHDDSAWTVKVDATAKLERRALPSATLACGLGFDEHARTRVSAVSVDPSAAASWTGDYAGNLRVRSFDGEADGHFEFAQERINLEENMDVHHFAWGDVRAGFAVTDPGDSTVYWVFQGV